MGTENCARFDYIKNTTPTIVSVVYIDDTIGFEPMLAGFNSKLS